MFINYTQEELQNLIDTRVEENLHLEYKSAGSLERIDSKKLEISKDVSAFANSDGWTIIYGIKEFDEKDKKHLPEKITPINRISYSKEWLEQVINSNIQPKINGLTIKSISLNSSHSDVAYVVEIPKSNTVHQSWNKAYYKRRNFLVDPMEDYEIRDVMNRLSSPELDLILDQNLISFNIDTLSFPIIIGNNSKHLAKDVLVSIEFLDFQNYNCNESRHFSDISSFNPGKKIYSLKNKIEIYNGFNLNLGFFNLKLKDNTLCAYIRCKIYCDNMFPTIVDFSIVINNSIPLYYINNEIPLE